MARHATSTACHTYGPTWPHVRLDMDEAGLLAGKGGPLILLLKAIPWAERSCPRHQ